MKATILPKKLLITSPITLENHYPALQVDLVIQVVVEVVVEVAVEEARPFRSLSLQVM